MKATQCRLRTRRLVAVGICAAVLTVSGCGQPSSAPIGTNHPPVLRVERHFVWIMSARTLTVAVADPEIRHWLAKSTVYELVPTDQIPISGLTAIPTVVFSSFQTFSQAASHGAIPPWARAVLYDNENWQYTPIAEQLLPGVYEARAGVLARQHHLIFLAAPAVDLVRRLQPGVGRLYPAYLALGLAASAARAAEVFDIQAQGSERSGRAFRQFVIEAADQARSANPHSTVLAGISTNPYGGPVTAAELESAISATATAVDGYWLNYPRPGTHCPRCGSPNPRLIVEVLGWLAGGTR